VEFFRRSFASLRMTAYLRMLVYQDEISTADKFYFKWRKGLGLGGKGGSLEFCNTYLQ